MDDGWLIKTDSNGDALWTKTFGGGNSDWLYSVDQTNDGGYILAGETYSFGVNSGDAWLIKTNSNGDTSWTKTFGGIIDDLGEFVQQTSDDGYILVGASSSSSPNNQKDVWLIRVKPDISEVYPSQSPPTNFHLFQNYPNPFNPTTTIQYEISERSFVELRVYDILGKEVASLVNKEHYAGHYELNFNGINLPSGVYFYQLRVGSFIETKKMVLLR